MRMSCGFNGASSASVPSTGSPKLVGQVQYPTDQSSVLGSAAERSMLTSGAAPP
jgi:hypothetical protein